MATYFGTASAWKRNASVYPAFDHLVTIPEGFAGTAGVFPFKVSDGRTPANRLPYAPNSASFNVIFHTDTPATGGITGPGATTPGDFVVWTSANGTTVGDGPSPSDFLEPGDPLTDLSSSPATAGQVPESDGAGGITWATPAAGGGINQLTGDVTAGPGSGSQAATLANTAVTPGAYTAANITIDSKGRITAAASGTTGDVTGPASSTDNAAVRFDGTTGKVIQNGVVTIGDTGAVAGVLTLNGSTPPAAPGTLATLGTNLNLFGSGAATAGQVPEADGVGGVAWNNIAGTGDVVGPASSTDGTLAQWDGVTGKLLKDGLATSTGGNGVADNGLVAIYGPQGQLRASSTSGGNYAVRATGTLGGIAGLFEAAGGTGIEVTSSTGMGASIITSGDAMGLQVQNDSSTTEPTLDVTNVGTADIAHFEGPTGGLHLLTDGGAQWTSGTGAQTTATNLPAFGALTKGVVPAAGAVPVATKYLNETGGWTTPPDTDTGINQLTGDVTAGPGNGSQVATLANTAVSPAAYTYASLTVDSKGRLTAASSGTTPLLPANDLSDVSSAATARTNIEVIRGLRDTVGSGQTTTSTTLANITGISIPVAAGAHVSIHLRVLFEVSSASGGIGLGINGSTAATYFAGRFETTQASGNFAQPITSYSLTTNATTCPVLNTVYYAEVHAELVNGGSISDITPMVARGGSGTLTIRAASMEITGG